MAGKRKELSTVYWSGLVVPIVVCVLILSCIVVIITSNIGLPHPLLISKKLSIPKGVPGGDI
jgi:hypothetical protein